jgi:iron complex transport system substrate-binding protein
VRARRVRLSAALVSALVMAASLSACADEDEPAAAAASAANVTSPTPAGTPSATSATGERLVTHDKGQTAVPAAASRVVVLDSPHLDAVLSLGLTPIGSVRSGEDEGLPAYLSDRTAGVELVGTIEIPNLEAIAALQPDLILSATVRHEELYDKLSAIAPTVFTAGSGTNWREGFQLVAEALGRADSGEQMLADYDAQADRIGEAIGASGKKAAIVRFLPDETRIYGPSTFSGSVLTDVGFTLPDLTYDEYSMAYISPEEIDQASADVIFATTYGDPEESTRSTVTPLWDRLTAVQEGCQFDVEDGEWMIGIGLIGAKIILADLDQAFDDEGECVTA